jgi:hypothetical protein
LLVPAAATASQGGAARVGLGRLVGTWRGDVARGRGEGRGDSESRQARVGGRGDAARDTVIMILSKPEPPGPFQVCGYSLGGYGLGLYSSDSSLEWRIRDMGPVGAGGGPGRRPPTVEGRSLQGIIRVAAVNTTRMPKKPNLFWSGICPGSLARTCEEDHRIEYSLSSTRRRPCSPAIFLGRQRHRCVGS